MSKRGKILGVGCLSTLIILLCIVISVIVTTASSNGSASVTPTPTSVAKVIQPTVVATAKPTRKPTTIPKPVPTQKPTYKPQPTATPTTVPTGVNGNPWGYDFNQGNLIYNPNGDFCSYFTCVSTFWKYTSGYVAECTNGSYTHSGGVKGACSRDGGVSQLLYSH